MGWALLWVLMALCVVTTLWRIETALTRIARALEDTRSRTGR
jgi:hypothetical protein